MSKPPTHRFYKEHPLRCAPDDYWGQVRRTLHGAPVPEAQILLIQRQVAALLELSSDDWLLDLCCGNGALTTRWFEGCRGGLGVDFSGPLIDVAQRAFARPPDHSFVLASVGEFAARPAQDTPFTKASCYGSMQYLTVDQVSSLWTNLRQNHPTIERVVIGNIPDRDREPAVRGSRPPVDLDNPDSAIGVWWSPAVLRELLDAAGWRLHVHRMPSEFYAGHYRFDALLTPREG